MFKRRYPVNDTFAWPSKEAAKVCGCSKSDVGPIMQKLEKLGAISLVQAGISKEAMDANKKALVRLVNFEGANDEYCAKPVL